MKPYKKPKSGKINVELQEYRRKRAERLDKTPAFLKALYKK